MMNQVSELTLSTELRHLSSLSRIQLSSIMDTGDSWKRLASVIPKPDNGNGYLLTSANITLLDQQKHVPCGSPTQALLDYWSTSGRKRVTIGQFIDLLCQCKLYRAADYVCQELLHIRPVERSDENDCGNVPFKWNDITNKLGNLTVNCDNLYENRPLTPTAPIESISNISLDDDYNLNNDITKYSYFDLKIATNDFNESALSMGGCKIGEGAFGAVFRGQLPDSDKLIAIKKLKTNFEKQFLAELKIMNKFKHCNLLSLCGISFDGPSLCIIYDYMPNGSLLDRLSCIDNTPALLWEKRISIAIGTARGIYHLHTFGEKPYVHRDIKSANILLDEHFSPRVGDFGLARIGSTGLATATNSLATTVIGTSVYMAPEAFRGDVSVKLDTFSFGIVLLELLTGLLPYDDRRDEPDLLSYLEERINDRDGDDCIAVNTFLDTAAGQWNESISLELYKISCICTEQRKKFRPTMVEVLQLLEKLP